VQEIEIDPDKERQRPFLPTPEGGGFRAEESVSVMRTEGMEGCVDWVQNLWAHWTEAWNTWPEGEVTRERVREWRAALIAAALYTRLPGEKGK